MKGSEALAGLVGAMAEGSVDLVDLTAPLGPDTPLLRLPPELGVDTPRVEISRISAYDDTGPFWAWNALHMGEHSGTHFEAPSHWITGLEVERGHTDSLPLDSFVAPACVVDCTEAVGADADFLLEAEAIEEWEAEHGALNAGEWLLMRSGWAGRAEDEAAFLNADEDGGHWPGLGESGARLLVERGAAGFGTECVGLDGGQSAALYPPYPAHNILCGAGRVGLASLRNLERLPPRGALLLAAPLKLVGGTGSPVRALALVPAR